MTATLPVEASAWVSPDGVYRYRLGRRWGDGLPLRWIMLNPSTADATKDDATIRRCMGFARRFGFNAIVVHNLFALRATNPAELLQHPSPVGPENDAVLGSLPAAQLTTVCAWGAHSSISERAEAVLSLLRDRGVVPMCLGRTKAGHPRHPLYLPADAELEEL